MNGIKTILCYGDSNTYGLSPEWMFGGPPRHDENTRWPMLLGKLLGEGYRVIESGLSGRTTVFDDPTIPERNGMTHLRVCIESHLPLDLVLIALGTNDTKEEFHASAEDIRDGLVRLLEMMNDPSWYFLFPKPKIMVLCPAPIEEVAIRVSNGAVTPLMLEKSRRLSALFAGAAEEHGCAFFDIATAAAASQEDGVHMDAAAHRALAQVLAIQVKEVLE